MRVLGLIPARGGSKGVKNKNIRIIAGEPLIQYAIHAAQASQKLTGWVVSTDSPQIRAVAEAGGARVIERPGELATDTSSVVDAALYTLAALEAGGEPYDAVMLIQPTAPVRTGGDLDRAVEMLEAHPELDGVVSVVRVEDTHPARMYRMEESGTMTSLWPENETTRRQDLPPVYLRSGSIYLIRRTALVEGRTFMPEKKAGLVMQSEFLVNIDTERDMALAEIVLREWKEKMAGTGC
jgi:CMP-N,N'-diacetyllegionaminic acid synthase